MTERNEIVRIPAPALHKRRKTDACIVCKQAMYVDKPVLHIHMTTAGKFVPKDYKGEDSQGWFPIGKCCAKEFVGLTFMFDVQAHLARFQKGSGCFTCALCGKKTRQVEGNNANKEFCIVCIREMEEANRTADRGV
jgi:hypothetical protein